MVISDNGASPEGGPTGTTNERQFFNNAPESLEESLAKLDNLGGPKNFNHYAWGWTWAGNTPFRRWKRETYRGGISDPFIVHWPKGIKAKGEIRTQYAHAIDMVPTVLDALGIEPPAVIKGVTQSPIEGVSFAHSFNDAKVPSKHITQYFEMLGHRSLYHDGWRAVCPWPGPSFTEAGKPLGMPISAETLAELDAHGWELYHVAEDIAENHNVAADNRARVIDMIATWYVEAGKYKVLPIDGSGLQRFAQERPQLVTGAHPLHVLPGYADGAVVSPRSKCSTARTASPPMSRSRRVARRASCCARARFGRLFVLRQGWQAEICPQLGEQGNLLRRVSGIGAGGPSPVALRVRVTGKPDIPMEGNTGPGQLYIDGKLVGDAEMPVTTPLVISPGGITCGANPGSARHA